jgi:hypothetical protein
VFSSPHPSLPVFASNLNTECNRLIAKRRRVMSGHEKAEERLPISWPSIPKDYVDFCPFAAQHLLTTTSPSRSTRSAVKKAKRKFEKGREQRLQAAKRRVVK